MPSATANSARCRRWAQKCQTKGLTRVTVQVPAEDADAIRAIAARMRERALPSPPEPSIAAPEPQPWEEAFGGDWMTLVTNPMAG